jgi:UDP-N-acetylmuramoyl-L-alanyl-D-glutamate--2,6-diaminopimelate ligase
MATLRLSDLLEGVPGLRVEGNARTPINEVRDDSRLVQPGDLFVAVAGTKEDGRRFIQTAVERGAAAVLAEGEAPAGVGTFIVAESARKALGKIAANRYGAAKDLTLTAVTGTSGKTTMTYLLESILTAAGRRPGVVGTVTYRYPGVAQAAPLTTPGPLQLHAFFAEMRGAGCTDAVLEASSHALEQGRVHGCAFRVAALTNVTLDHLDYHGTKEAYFAAKAILFRELLHPAGGTAVVFADREDGRRMLAEVRGRALTVATTPGAKANVRVTERALDGRGTRATLATPAGPLEITSPLVGDYNLENMTLAAGMALAHDVPLEAIARGIAALSGVPGRLERVANDAGVLCLVDYSHKPDALERALAALRPLTARRLILVFGCGGDRDRTKRPIMGEAAARGADVVLVTSDNPRTEEPRSIIDMIVPGVVQGGGVERSVAELAAGSTGFHVEPDRRAAIRAAVSAAREGDTLVIAGKGHEDYQILGAVKIHFDDREEAAAAFAERGAR